MCLSFLIISFLVGFQLTADSESCLLWFATHVTKKIKTTCTASILYLKDHHSYTVHECKQLEYFAKRKPEKNITSGLNGIQTWCSALPTELSRKLGDGHFASSCYTPKNIEEIPVYTCI